MNEIDLYLIFLRAIGINILIISQLSFLLGSFFNGKQLVEDGKQLFEHGKQLVEDGKQLFEHGKQLFEHGKQLFEHGRQLFEHGRNHQFCHTNCHLSKLNYICAL